MSFDPGYAKDNAMLLYRLKEAKGARSFGSVAGFFDTTPDFRCPGCFRKKEETARVDKNFNLLCAYHWHHDHFGDYFDEDFRSMLRYDYAFSEAIHASLIRFPRTLICNDCNVAEPHAKKIVEAPSQFSFTPYEISHFVTLDTNGDVRVDPERAKEAYEAALPAMRLLASRLRAIRAGLKGGGSQFEPLAQTALRVVSQLKVIKGSKEE